MGSVPRRALLGQGCDAVAGEGLGAGPDNWLVATAGSSRDVLWRNRGRDHDTDFVVKVSSSAK
jgi:microcompartment protein CcmK/EutM